MLGRSYGLISMLHSNQKKKEQNKEPWFWDLLTGKSLTLHKAEAPEV